MRLTGSVVCDCDGSAIAIIYIRNVCESVYTIKKNLSSKIYHFFLPLINPSSCCQFHSLALDAQHSA